MVDSNLQLFSLLFTFSLLTSQKDTKFIYIERTVLDVAQLQNACVLKFYTRRCAPSM